MPKFSALFRGSHEKRTAGTYNCIYDDASAAATSGAGSIAHAPPWVSGLVAVAPAAAARPRPGRRGAASRVERQRQVGTPAAGLARGRLAPSLARVRELHLVEQAFPGRAAFDTAVSRALMLRVADGRAPETFRLYRPDAILAFSALDRVRPGYGEAVAAARAAGFAPVLRLAGGRAAAFHPGTLAFAWSRPAPELRGGIEARFDEMAAILVAALRALGVDARAGEVPGEWCPGAHSVNARGRVKLAGIGQRVVRGAAHVGGVLVAEDAGRARDALAPVYAALGLPLDPASFGAAADEAPGATLSGVAAALRAELARRFALVEAALDAETLALAGKLAPEHEADTGERFAGGSAAP
jgi:lipoate-protein ligase A